jgi:hypothetical protein
MYNQRTTINTKDFTLEGIAASSIAIHADVESNLESLHCIAEGDSLVFDVDSTLKVTTFRYNRCEKIQDHPA